MSKKRKKNNHRGEREREVAQRKDFLFCESKKERLRPRNAAETDPSCRASRQGILLFALAKRRFFPLCYLSPLCVSVVNFSSPPAGPP